MAARPETELTEPIPYDPIPNLVENIVGAAQYISPAYWLGMALEKITGTNPYMWVVQHWAGDYEAVQQAGLALKQLGEFNTLYATALADAEAQAIPYDWEGNAADSAHEYFQGFAGAVREQSEALREVGDQFETMAVGVYAAAQGFKGFFELLVDRAIILVLQWIKAQLSGWTGAGAVVSAMEITITILQGRWAWQKALEYHDRGWHAVTVFTGTTAGYLGGLRGMDLVALPSRPYDHPGV